MSSLASLEKQFKQSFTAAGGAASRRAAGFEATAAGPAAPSFCFLQHRLQQRPQATKSTTPGTPSISLRFASGQTSSRSHVRHPGLTPGGAATPASAFGHGRAVSAYTPYSTPGRATYRSAMSRAAARPSTSMQPPLDAGWGALPEPRIVSVPSLLDGGWQEASHPAILPVSTAPRGLSAVQEHSGASGGSSSGRGGSSSGREGSASSSQPSSARSSVATEPRQRPTLRPTVRVGDKPPSSHGNPPAPSDGSDAWGLYSQALVGAGGVHRQQQELLEEGAAAEAYACAATAGLTRSRALYTPGVWVEPAEPPPAPPLDADAQNEPIDSGGDTAWRPHVPISDGDLQRWGGGLTSEARQQQPAQPAQEAPSAPPHPAPADTAEGFSGAVLDAVFAGVVSSGSLDWGAVFAAVGLGRTDDGDVLQEADVEYESAIPVGSVAVAQGLSPATLRTWLPRSGVLLTGGEEALPGGGVALPAVDVLPMGNAGGGSSAVKGALDDTAQEAVVVHTPSPHKPRRSRIPRLKGSPSMPGAGGALARQHAAAARAAVAQLPSWAPRQPIQALGVSPTKAAEQERAWQNKYSNAYLGVVRGAQRPPAAQGSKGARQHAKGNHAVGDDAALSPGTQVVHSAVQSTVADFLSDPRIADMVQGAVRSRLRRAYEHKEAVQRLRGRFARAHGLQASVGDADGAHGGALQVLRGEVGEDDGGYRANSPPPPPPPMEN